MVFDWEWFPLQLLLFSLSTYLLSNEAKNQDNDHDKHTLYAKLGYFDGIGLFDLAKCIFYAPINTLFYFSIPDCKIERLLFKCAKAYLQF